MFGESTPEQQAMDDTKLLAVIHEFETESYGFGSGQLAADRSYAIERYLAEPYGDEIEGRSGVVDTGLRDTIEWLLPQVLRVFMSGDEIVKIDPTNESDEEQAKQETDYLNHVILEKNDAFNVFSTWFRDGCLSKVGYVKAYWQDRQDVLQESYKGITDDQLMMVEGDKDVRIVAKQSYPDPQAHLPNPGMPIPNPGSPPAPAPIQAPPQAPPMLHDVKLRRVKTQGYAKVDNVPPEELYVHRSLRTINMEQAQFVQHRARRTISELRQDGYQIDDDIPTTGDDAGEVNDTINISRDRFADDDQLRGDFKAVDPSQRRVWFRESYLRVDFDGDGVAELRKVCTIGNEILANEETDIVPFAAVTPIIFPHRHIGIGFDDLCEQPSRTKTALSRAFLDNQYQRINGRYGVDVNKVNVDDMLVSRPGGVVRTDGDPSAAIVPLTHPTNGDDALKGMEWTDRWRVESTGVSSDQANLSPDVLNGSTATGIAQAVSAGQSRVEAITRSFATGVKELFGIVHAITLKNATSDEKVKLNNNWVTVDPREWVKRTGMTITVGLGAGTKQTRIAALTQLAQMQAQGMQIGICQPANLYHTGTLITQEMGYKNMDEFWSDPVKHPQPPPPNPLVQVEQMKQQGAMQLAQAKGQAEGQMKMQQLQVEDQHSQRQAQAALAVQQANDQRDAARAQMDAQLKHEQFQMEMAQRDQEHAREQDNAYRIANVKASAEVEVARIKAAADKGDEVLNEELVAAGQKPLAPNPVTVLAGAISQLVPHLAAQNGPKRVVRGPDGRVAGIEPVTVQ